MCPIHIQSFLHIFDVRNGMLLINKQFILIHTIIQTKVPALLESWVTNTTSAKMPSPQKILLLIFSQKQNRVQSSSRLHTVRITRTLNIRCHSHDEFIVLFKYFNNF
jgi:hypothetical protein